MIEDVLQFTTSCLTVGAPQRGRVEEGYGIGAVTIPGAKQVVPLILGYGRNGQQVEGGTYWVSPNGQPRPQEETLEIPYKLRIGSAPAIPNTVRVPYPNERVRSLCLGKWVTAGVGAVQVDPTAILPTVKWVGTMDHPAVQVTWDKPPVMRLEKRRLRWISVGVRGIEINEFGGKLLTDRPLVNWLLPELIWG